MRQLCRVELKKFSTLESVLKGEDTENKFGNYAKFSQRLSAVREHQVLAIFRGEAKKVLGRVER